MKTQKKDLVKLLKEITTKIKSVSDDDFSKWINGELDLKIQFIPKKQKKEKQKPTKSKEEYGIILEKLQSFPTREQGHQFLLSSFPNKSNLEGFARFIDVPVIKRDNIEQLRDKVIEATVGAIIRSNAIQGD